jgi:hypothetical protein
MLAENKSRKSQKNSTCHALVRRSSASEVFVEGDDFDAVDGIQRDLIAHRSSLLTSAARLITKSLTSSQPATDGRRNETLPLRLGES